VEKVIVHTPPRGEKPRGIPSLLGAIFGSGKGGGRFEVAFLGEKGKRRGRMAGNRLTTKKGGNCYQTVKTSSH